jgi:hypothetical protein
MMSLYGTPGMGTAGTGIPSGGNVSMQQMLAMLQQGGGGSQATPFNQAGGAPTPMAGYIGAPGGAGGGGMQRPAMAPLMPQQQQQGMGQAAEGGAGKLMQQIALLQKLKQGQNGLAPAPTPDEAHATGMTDQGAMAAAQQAGQGAQPGMMEWLRSLMSSGGGGGGAGAMQMPGLY